MGGLVETNYVVCECGCKRFIAKDTFMIQKRDLGVILNNVVVSRQTDTRVDYFCADCGKEPILQDFLIKK